MLIIKKLPQLPSATQALMNNLKHETLSVRELRSSVQDKLTHHNGKFSILYLDVMKNPQDRCTIDIGALQAQNPGALFQAASRPSSLEGTQMVFLANKEKTESGDVFNYEMNGFNKIIGSHAVQGEEAAVSSAIKAIYQIYYIDKNINLFTNIGVKTNARGRIEKINSEFLTKSTENDLSDNISVRIWQNVPVTTGCSNVLYQSDTIAEAQAEGKQFNASVRQKNSVDANTVVAQPCFISQINVSAVDLSKDKKTKYIRGFGEDDVLATKVAKAALKAAYEATIYGAIKTNSKKVFLTLVGCGAFQNKLEWVAEILDNLTDTIKQSGLDITLVAMDANGHLSEKQKKAWDVLQNIVTKTNTIKPNHLPLDPIKKDLVMPTSENSIGETEIHAADKKVKPFQSNNNDAPQPTEAKKSTFFSSSSPFIVGGLSIIGILLALKYYFQSNTTEK